MSILEMLIGIPVALTLSAITFALLVALVSWLDLW
jgi:hypothetical protein